jgi:hypothetical protein
MKKISHNYLDAGDDLRSHEKQSRENVWCAKYGYFIDLDACRARSLQQKTCRRCFASLIQVPLPF